jgi:polyhydroxyalkanoate synthase subunit PhaC
VERRIPLDTVIRWRHSVRLTNQNHTQTISARGDNKHLRFWMANELPPNPDDWLANASETKGDWRDHWFKWLAAHSGDRVQAPSLLGSNKHPRSIRHPAGM